jgi:hypothetical protein
MLLLAIQVGFPEEATRLLPALMVDADAGRDPTRLLQSFAEVKLDGEAFQQLETRIAPVVRSGSFPRGPELYREWVPRVARFSFEVGRAVQRRRLGQR